MFFGQSFGTPSGQVVGVVAGMVVAGDGGVVCVVGVVARVVGVVRTGAGASRSSRGREDAGCEVGVVASLAGSPPGLVTFAPVGPATPPLTRDGADPLPATAFPVAPLPVSTT